MNKWIRVCFIILIFLPIITPSAYAIDRISVSTEGIQGNDHSQKSSLNADGRFVVFVSAASNLVTDDTNGYKDVFIHDRETGITERVSVSSNGTQADGGSSDAAISADGRFVAFNSFAENLVDGDINGATDTFVHDRKTSITELVSVSSNGIQGNFGSSNGVSISADGRFVVFASRASSLGDNLDEYLDVFIHDRNSRLTEHISTATNYPAFTPVISANGRYVAYTGYTYGTCCVGGSVTSGGSSVFIYDQNSKQTTRIESTIEFRFPSISADGRFIALDTEDCDYCGTKVGDIYLHDQKTGLTKQIDLPFISLYKPSNYSRLPSISNDGRYIVYRGTDSNLVEADTNKIRDILIYDRISEQTELVGPSPGSNHWYHGDTRRPRISGDGKFISYSTDAAYLVKRDTNGDDDVFIVENPIFKSTSDLTLQKTINTDSSDPATGEVISLMANGRLYRADYRVTNTSSNKRMYQIKITDTIDGNLHVACSIPGLLPGQSKRCQAHYPVQKGFNSVPAEAIAKVSGSKTMVSVVSTAAYQGHRVRGGKLEVAQSLNKGPGDRQRDAVLVEVGAEQQWSYRVENTTNVNLYKVKVYLDGQLPNNTHWEQQCFLGRLKPGEVRYCNREQVLGEPGLNLAQGWAQGVDAMPLHGKYEHVTNLNHTWYQLVP